MRIPYGVIAEIVWDEAILSFREQQLRRDIDKALAERDKAAFFALTAELKDLLKFK